MARVRAGDDTAASELYDGLYLTLAFTAGLLAGGVAGGLTGLKHGLTRPLRALPPQQMAADIGLRLQRDLRLSEDQRLQVAPIVETFVRQMETLQSNAVAESVLAIRQMHRQIEPMLTPEQQARFREIQQVREAEFHRATQAPNR